MVTSWVLLSNRKISKKKNCRVSNRVVCKLVWFVSRFHQIDSYQNFSEDRALFSSSVNQSFRRIVRFTLVLRSVEFMFWSRSCYWFGLIRVQFVCFSDRFHQFLATTANFFHFRTVFSSNSESVRKTAITFAYELRFWCSIYQNRWEQIFGSVYLRWRRVR